MDEFISPYDKKEIERWGALLEVIDPLIVFITHRETTLLAQREQARKKPSLDTAFITTDLDAKLAELKELRREITYRTDLYKKEVLNDR